ncbi:lytic transglycosylase, partial [Streptomyces sp. MCAF7]
MPVPRIPGYSRLTKTHKFSAAGIAAAGAAALA